MSPHHVFPDQAALVEGAGDWLFRALTSTLAARKTCSLALSGGRTPAPIYLALSARPGIDWSRVVIYFADERAVPPDDPESNYRLARETLLSRVAIQETQVHRMEAERPDRDAAAHAYDRLLPARLDVLLLGMGADGHTASLFPGSPALDERERRVLPVIGPKPPIERLTLTPPVIGAARQIAVVAAGEDKARAVADVLEGPINPSDHPAQIVQRRAWLLDAAAASLLTGTGPRGYHSREV